MNKRIFIFGLGYVGMSLSTLFAANNRVDAYDIDKKRVDQVRNGYSTVKDADIQEFLDNTNLNLNVVEDLDAALAEADYVIICTPTNFDQKTLHFDTKSVDQCVLRSLDVNAKCSIIIKSTLPIGHVAKLQEKYQTDRIAFCPEFLQEGTALRDNLQPERIVIGCSGRLEEELRDLFLSICTNKRVPVIQVAPTEAEAVKLFANSYLAMRIAFFNELDTYSFANGLDALKIIRGVSCDSRIGDYYNNPSFGFGGYCLPKDVAQINYELSLLDNYKSPLINSILDSNNARKHAISSYTLQKNVKTVGIYRLSMKKDSDNFREAAVHEIIDELRRNDKEVLIYEPLIEGAEYNGYKIQNDLSSFIENTDVILANRMHAELHGVGHIITRDIFATN